MYNMQDRWRRWFSHVQHATKFNGRLHANGKCEVMSTVMWKSMVMPCVIQECCHIKFGPPHGKLEIVGLG